MMIDEHRHVGYTRANGTRTAEEIIAEMDRLGVDRAVIAPSGMKNEPQVSDEEEVAGQRKLMEAVRECIEGGRVTPEIEERRRGLVDHEDVLAAVRRYPERLIGCWWVNPWRGEEDCLSAAAAVRELGFRCVKLHPLVHVFAADDAVMSRVMEWAAEIDVPVWFHSSYGPGTEVRRIARLAARFPGTRVILGHAGVRDLAGEEHSREAAAAARASRNVWIDLSDCHEEPMRRMIENAPGDRLVLASDDPFGRLERQVSYLREIAGEDSELFRMISGGNASALLGVSA
ncbi:MAG: amidohydrolase family protein [Planctomycetota bacterium]